MARNTVRIAEWRTLVDNPEVADNGGNVIVDPDISIDAANDTELYLPSRIIDVRIRFGYDNAHDGGGGSPVVTVNPVIQAFGIRFGGTKWERLYTMSDEHEVTMTTDVDDVDDGTLKYTDSISILVQGFERFIAGVKTAFDSDTGTKTNSILQALVVV